MQKFHTFLMFDGQAEEAMNFYLSLFLNSKIDHMFKYGSDQPAMEGKVMHAVFSLNGQEFMAMDSNEKHGFTFTPSVSISVQCENEGEIDTLYGQLTEGGKVLMPLDNYGFSKKYGWVNDKYGVSWQLNLA